MRADAPAPSMSSLLSSWLALTGWMFAICAERANTLVEGGEQRLDDAVTDVGCPPGVRQNDAGELPSLDPASFAAGLREAAEQALLQAAELINEEPNACMEAVTRDRVQKLFGALADEVLAVAMERRIAAAESERGETEAPEWVRRYRRMLAAEGRWPPGDEPIGQERKEVS